MLSAILSLLLGLTTVNASSVPPVTLTGDVTVVKLDTAPLRAHGAKPDAAILRIDEVVADRSPGVTWEVYAGRRDVARDPSSPSYLGSVALYGAGIRSESRGELRPAHFVFPLGPVIRSAPHLWSEGNVYLTFVPQPPPGAARARPAASVQVGRIAICFESGHG